RLARYFREIGFVIDHDAVVGCPAIRGAVGHAALVGLRLRIPAIILEPAVFGIGYIAERDLRGAPHVAGYDALPDQIHDVGDGRQADARLIMPLQERADLLVE